MIQQLSSLINCYIIPILLGIVSGIITNKFWDAYKSRKKVGKLMGLCCLWLEKHTGEGFSLGSFYWNKTDRSFHYDGTRFDKTGKAIYHWYSRSLFVDDKMNVVVYTYEHQFLNENKKEYGLGQVNYHIPDGDDKNIIFKDGVFSDNGESMHIDLDMHKFSQIEEQYLMKEKTDSESRIKLGKMYAREMEII